MATLEITTTTTRADVLQALERGDDLHADDCHLGIPIGRRLFLLESLTCEHCDVWIGDTEVEAIAHVSIAHDAMRCPHANTGPLLSRDVRCEACEVDPLELECKRCGARGIVTSCRHHAQERGRLLCGSRHGYEVERRALTWQAGDNPSVDAADSAAAHGGSQYERGYVRYTQAALELGQPDDYELRVCAEAWAIEHADASVRSGCP